MRLMTVLLTRNPYGAELRLSQWTTDYAVAIETFTAMQQAAGLTVDALQQQQTEREEDAPEEEEEEEDHESATEDTGDDNASSQREIPQELAMQALKVPRTCIAYGSVHDSFFCMCFRATRLPNLRCSGLDWAGALCVCVAACRSSSSKRPRSSRSRWKR